MYSFSSHHSQKNDTKLKKQFGICSGGEKILCYMHSNRLSLLIFHYQIEQNFIEYNLKTYNV